MSAAIAARALRWAAGSDRIAHAFPPRERLRALCGVGWLDPRMEWPALRRCLGCTALAEERRD